MKIFLLHLSTLIRLERGELTQCIINKYHVSTNFNHKSDSINPIIKPWIYKKQCDILLKAKLSVKTFLLVHITLISR